MERTDRLRLHGIASGALVALADEEVESLIASAQKLGSGIGGETFRVFVNDVPVFVKRITLTAPELSLANPRSTANLFQVPNVCHYGIGSPGFSAWREVAAHDITSNWVLAGEAECFPLTYHRRVLAGEPPRSHDELRDTAAVVDYWGRSFGLRARLHALKSATAVVWIFLEDIPVTLGQWLALEVGRRESADWDEDIRMIERNLCTGTDFMARNGFIHFDAHFENILTDGQALYFTDFGLALSTDFDLESDEREFFENHVDYDRSYAFTYLIRWLLVELAGVDREDLGRAVDGVLTGRSVINAPPAAVRAIDRYAPVAAIMIPFYRELQTVSRTTTYPRGAEQKAWAAVDASR